VTEKIEIFIVKVSTKKSILSPEVLFQNCSVIFLAGKNNAAIKNPHYYYSQSFSAFMT